MGDRLHRGPRPNYATAWSWLEDAWLHTSPFFDRLCDGRIAPAAYGPASHPEARKRWLASIFGGGLWDFAADLNRPAPVDEVGLTASEYLDSTAHTMPDHVLEILLLGVRARNRAPAIARRTGYTLHRVERILATFLEGLRQARAELAERSS